ncbi:hypothetical protein EUGRSUZ_H03206 [Eucalyptus grandis]|uniref:Uncharacterized protein n=4 Tax=Eucalyptus grandis TaxID=71139 RepID=A0ACC3K5E6_EUCGR|nr:hypothetical protein EUGRSUZ_H03206 [Eucalyptus grandis]
MEKKRGGSCVPSLRALRCYAVMFGLCLGLPSSAASPCKKKPVIFNFGDSNSDTGGWSAGLGIDVALPNGRTFFHEATGRLCDGRLTIDFLCESLNTSFLSPYLESLGPNFSDGANFAVSGAATTPRDQPFSLGVQLRQFLLFRSRSPLLLSRGHANLVGEDGFADALYTIDIGQNDLTAQFRTLPYLQVIGNIPTFIEEIRFAIWSIYHSGGKNFWLHNTGPLGCLPGILVAAGHDASDIDELGCLRSRNDAAREFNRRLQSLCEELRTQMKNATIVYVDVFAIKYNLIANYTIHGFENPSKACYNNGTVCEESSRHVSWDGIHYTEAANSFVASRILSANYSTPPITFNFFCNV